MEKDYRERISLLADTPEIGETERVEISAKISNAKTLSKHLRNMTLEEVQKGFIIEMETRQRPYILHRLESKTRVLKQEVWNKELSEALYVDEKCEN